MPAQPGNKLASKWTRERTDQYLKIIEEQAADSNVPYLHHALAKAELHRNTWRYWQKIWSDDEDLIDRMMMVEQLFENKLLESAMQSRCHIGRAMMVLRSKYDYVEERHRLIPKERKSAKRRKKRTNFKTQEIPTAPPKSF